MKRVTSFFISYLLFSIPLFTQLQAQTQIRGTVKGVDGAPLAFAEVLLFPATENKWIKGEITDSNGNYQLNNLRPGSYIVKLDMLGFKEYRTTPFLLSDQSGEKNLGVKTLKADIAQLHIIEIIGKTPLFDKQVDRLVINVANTITFAGDSALEILEKSPGMIVNRQNNAISIKGKSGVVVMINDRVNYISADAVIQLLASMSADNIEKIELITTPPAGFDAEGNLGLINIVLKKNLDEG